jgi:hypothetical protein
MSINGIVVSMITNSDAYIFSNMQMSRSMYWFVFCVVAYISIVCYYQLSELKEKDKIIEEFSVYANDILYLYIQLYATL